MRIHGRHYRTIRLRPDTWSVEIIDQQLLPFRFETLALQSMEDAARAIHIMQARVCSMDKESR